MISLKNTSNFWAELKSIKECILSILNSTAQIVNVGTYEEMMSYKKGKQKILFIVANDSQYSLQSTVYLWDGSVLITFMAQKNSEQPT